MVHSSIKTIGAMALFIGFCGIIVCLVLGLDLVKSTRVCRSLPGDKYCIASRDVFVYNGVCSSLWVSSCDVEYILGVENKKFPVLKDSKSGKCYVDRVTTINGAKLVDASISTFHILDVECVQSKKYMAIFFSSSVGCLLVCIFMICAMSYADRRQQKKSHLASGDQKRILVHSRSRSRSRSPNDSFSTSSSASIVTATDGVHDSESESTWGEEHLDDGRGV